MSNSEALDLVCNTAIAWAEEYGFSMPAHATEIFEAVEKLRPELVPEAPSDRG